MSVLHTDRFIHGHPIQVILTDRQEAQGLSQLEQWAVRNICDTLLAHYPGHPWAVRVDDAPTVGIAVIKHVSLSQNFGFMKKLANIKDDPAFRWVVLGAGEILERFNVDRRGYQKGIFNDATPVFNDVPLVGKSGREQYTNALRREDIVRKAASRRPQIITDPNG